MRITSATEATMIAAPISAMVEIDSSLIRKPRTIATTGFTYAYVETLEIGAFCSSHAYAL